MTKSLISAFSCDFRCRSEIKNVDNVDSLREDNNKLKDEIQQNKTIVNEAKGAKRRIEAAENSLSEEKEKTKRARQERKRYYDLLHYQRQQTADLRKKIEDHGDVDQLKADFERLWTEFHEMQQSYDNLLVEMEEKEEELEKLREEAAEVIQTTDEKGNYEPRFRLLVQQVLGRNVPHQQVSPLISDVFSYFNRKASSLPSLKTIGHINLERLAISQRHVGVRAHICQSVTWTLHQSTMVENRKKHRQNSHPINNFPTSEPTSERSGAQEQSE